MHAPYRRYLEIYSSVAVTQVLSVWCVHEISVRFPEVCDFFSISYGSPDVANDFDCSKLTIEPHK